MKKKFRINLHLLFFVAIVAIVVVCILRLNSWNKRTKTVDLSDINEGDYDMECLDYYIYPDNDYSDGHVDNGVEDILIMGNVLVNSYGADHSIVNILRDRLDANIIDISVDKSLTASDAEDISYGRNSFSLYHLTSSLVEGNFHYQQVTEAYEGFQNDERYAKWMETVSNVDLMDVDTVIIMYSLQDYFAGVPTMYIDDKNVFGYHGALYSSIKLLKDTYPHLNIILSSPIPVYYTDEKGEEKLGTVTDFGLGNASIYVNHQYAVATQLCISFIDNYFYKINESNISDYTDGFFPNDDGIDLVADHIVRFLENKGVLN